MPYVPNTPYVPGTYVPTTLKIPKEACLFPADVSPAMKEPSKCHFVLHNVIRNVEFVGCDPLLNASAEEITRFFLTHMKKPVIHLQIEGKRVIGYTDLEHHCHLTPEPIYATDFV